mmetsp:Transcript_8889/g.39145  ORF Transcript_8889/g.39145 Transcript_8889/m.39145 type:complete len:540 (-) Transcript_8889:1918-3537(-)
MQHSSVVPGTHKGGGKISFRSQSDVHKRVVGLAFLSALKRNGDGSFKTAKLLTFCKRPCFLIFGALFVTFLHFCKTTFSLQSPGFHFLTGVNDELDSSACVTNIRKVCREAELEFSRSDQKTYHYNMTIVITLFSNEIKDDHLTHTFGHLHALENTFGRGLLGMKHYCSAMEKVDPTFTTEFMVLDAPDKDSRSYVHGALASHMRSIPKRCTFRTIRVPRRVIDDLPNPFDFWFPEYIIKNIGIRRSLGEWVLSSNAGILFNRKSLVAVHGLLKHAQTEQSSRRYVYRMDRVDLRFEFLEDVIKLPTGNPCDNVELLNDVPADILDKLETATMFRKSDYTTLHSEASGLACAGQPPHASKLECPAPWSELYLLDLESRIDGRAADANFSGSQDDCQVRPELAWAAGDFVLGHNVFWKISHGYPMVYGVGGVDSMMMCRVAGSCFAPVRISPGLDAGCSLLHLPHQRRPPSVHSKSLPHEMNGHRDLKSIEYCRAELCGLQGDSPLLIGNRRDWGLSNIFFEEAIQHGLRDRDTCNNQAG